MRAIVAGFCLSLVSAATCMGQVAQVSSTQELPPSDRPIRSSVYCSGFYSGQRVSDEMRLVTGEQSEYKATFTQGDIVYLSVGGNKGLQPGDRFLVMREFSDPLKVPMFTWQEKLTKAMGTYYVDLGQLEVIKVQPGIAIAKVSMSCDYMQRGDIIRPFVERPSGPYKDASTFDSLAPVSGKPTAMVVAGRDTQQVTGKLDTIYVNLGTGQGVKVGDYFRIFRYQGTKPGVIAVEKDYQDRLYGQGSNPRHYAWNDLPREVLGEGIVLNTSQSSATVLVTVAKREIYSGDYVELE
jgi:hypothetical protein